MSEWQALTAGFAFYLILEGLMPFFSPKGFKQILASFIEMPEQQVRIVGAVMLFLGVALLMFTKA